MGNSTFTVPPLGCSGPGFRCFFLLLMPSTIPRPVLTPIFNPSPRLPKGGTVNVEFPIDISNVMIFCDKCKKGVRIGIQYKDKNRIRVCRKCGKNFD